MNSEASALSIIVAPMNGPTGDVAPSAGAQRPISGDAERQRRRRERRRRGAVAVQLVISPAAIGDLIRLGWLRDSDRADRQAVKDAFVQFARWALGHA
jgi:hypothetical protein